MATRDTNEFLERVKDWPKQPGVYTMRDSANRILYIGKAKSLRNRIRSYFQEGAKLSPKTQVLIRKVDSLEFTVTNTELEALLLECNLIKKHRPRYNIRLKDDKNFPYVVLDYSHPFPQFRTTRKVVPLPHLKYFGPYSGGVREISRFMLKTFQLRDCTDAKFKKRTRPCLNYEIGTCTAPCVNLVTPEAYEKQVQEAALFLQGKKRELIKKLTAEMKTASEKTEYELAKTLRDRIFSIRKLTEKQNAILTENQRDIDVIGTHLGDGEIQIVVLFIRAGILTGRRTEKVPLILDSLEETIRSYIQQLYLFTLIPDEIWVVSDFEDRPAVEKALRERKGKKVKILARRNEKGIRLLGMAQENAKLLYLEGKKDRAKISASEELKNVLGLVDIPHTIEGIDVSNVQGTNPAVALVHFEDERALKSRYRLYYPKTVEGQNDFAMIHETLTRRLTNQENPPPDLFLIDGGVGQLRAATRALEDLKLTFPVCALAKSRTESGFTRKEVVKSEERIFIPNRKNPIVLREGNPALALLQRVRDEAHRFSVKSHRVRRTKEALEKSVLTELEGFGQKTREKLLKHFGSLNAVLDASPEALLEAGLNRTQVERLRGKSSEEE